MPTHRDSHLVVRFGTFEADLETGELRRKGLKVRMQQQPFEVLRMLLERPGDLVRRDELRQRLWPGSLFVEFDHGLNKAVHKIRPRSMFTFSPSTLRFNCWPTRCFAVAPNGQLFYGVQMSPAPPAPPVTQIQLVLNWTEEVRARLRTAAER